MKRTELMNDLSLALQQYGLPISIIDSSFMKAIYGGSEEFNFESVKENGFPKFMFSCNSFGMEHKYTMVMNPNAQKYEMVVQISTKKNFQLVDYSTEKITVAFDNRSWNNQPGFIVQSNKRQTFLNTGERKFMDKSVESKALYDKNGIEYKDEDIIREYPLREYRGVFEFGLPETNARVPERTIINTYYRDGLDRAIKYQVIRDMLGNISKSSEKYYHLSNERGLGTMNLNLGPINTREEYDSIPKTYTPEEIEELVRNDYGVTKEALIELFSMSKNL